MYTCIKIVFILTLMALSLLIICPGSWGGWGEGGRRWFNWAVASRLAAARLSLHRKMTKKDFYNYWHFPPIHYSQLFHIAYWKSGVLGARGFKDSYGNCNWLISHLFKSFLHNVWDDCLHSFAFPVRVQGGAAISPPSLSCWYLPLLGLVHRLGHVTSSPTHSPTLCCCIRQSDGRKTSERMLVALSTR